MTTVSDRLPNHFTEWFKNHAAARPNAVAIVTPSVMLTYGGFYRAVLAATHRLSEYGIKAGQTVAVCALSPGLYYVVLVALNRMGCVTLGLGWPNHAGAEIEAPRGLHVDRVLVEQPCEGIAPANAVNIGLEWLAAANDEQREWSGPGFADISAVAHIFTSSGTTGTAKAVGVSMRQLVKRVLWRNTGFEGLAPATRSLCRFGCMGSIGFKKAFGMFERGGTSFIGWPTDRIPGLIAQYRIQEIEGSPAHYAALLGRSGLSSFDLSSLRHATVAGSTVPQPLIALIRSGLCPAFTAEYGSAELGMMAFGPLREDGALGSCGHVAPWAQAQAVDDGDNVLPPGVEGILRFRCEGMPSGYLNDAAATAQHFRNGWFYPGDLGVITESRALTATGRTVERINAGGHKVGPEVIENAIMAFEGIEDCAAFGVPDDLGVEKIWAALVSRAPVDTEGLRKHCVVRLGESAPRQFLAVKAIPRNDAGKILRSKLRELAEVECAGSSET